MAQMAEKLAASFETPYVQRQASKANCSYSQQFPRGKRVVVDYQYHML
jgi:hypothetical protein